MNVNLLVFPLYVSSRMWDWPGATQPQYLVRHGEQNLSDLVKCLEIVLGEYWI